MKICSGRNQKNNCGVQKSCAQQDSCSDRQAISNDCCSTSIAIGSDHRGFALKQELIAHYTDSAWIDVGTKDEQRTDYPLYAQALCKLIQKGLVTRGILICGSGVGISIAANRFCGIYAALCWSPEVAALAKAHDNANVLVLPAHFMNTEQAIACVDAWLSTSFNGGHYAQRLAMIDHCSCT